MFAERTRQYAPQAAVEAVSQNAPQHPHTSDTTATNAKPLHLLPTAMAKFADLLVILKFFFENGVSEPQYHAIVGLIREYEKCRDSRTIEEASLVAVGWPTSYDPCEYKERMRVAFHFVRDGSETLDVLLSEWKHMTALAFAP